MKTTANCLIELGTEELPPKSLRSMIDSLVNEFQSELASSNIGFSEIKGYATPRRLTVFVRELALKQEDITEQKLGPAVAAAFDDAGNPSKAAQGFARSCGVAVEDLETVETPKGPRLGWTSVSQGAATTELLETIYTAALSRLPIAKRMRWGDTRAEFVRPVHWLLALVDDEVPNVSVLGLQAGAKTRGHRVHGDQDITVPSADDYEKLLEQARVVADIDRRRELVREAVVAQGKALGGNAVISDDLLDEVTALVEWPVALAGSFDPEFLEVPGEALVASMKEHQKYFHVVDEDGELMPNFITIANLESREPQRVIAGNERVIRPRLADARFFWEQDQKTSLETMRSRLNKIVFQKELGTVHDKLGRINLLAQWLAPHIGANATYCEQAAGLCKSDLVSEMVQEFPAMQGIAGSHYAAKQGLPEEVATALREHYLPRFAGDALPQTATGTALAIADRMDTLAGIFGIGQIPTGSKDPFALRRASLGVLRILIEQELDIDLAELIKQAGQAYPAKAEASEQQLQDYMIERLRAYFEEQGISTLVFNAVAALGVTRPFDFSRRVSAVAGFARLPAAEALAAANKRVSNLLQKADSLDGTVDPDRFTETAEKDLAQQIAAQSDITGPLCQNGDYAKALESLAALRDTVDAFFDQVMVMADDEAVRTNRLLLLRDLKHLFLQVADVACLQT